MKTPQPTHLLQEEIEYWRRLHGNVLVRFRYSSSGEAVLHGGARCNTRGGSAGIDRLQPGSLHEGDGVH